MRRSCKSKQNIIMYDKTYSLIIAFILIKCRTSKCDVKIEPKNGLVILSDAMVNIVDNCNCNEASSALIIGKNFSNLPRTIPINLSDGSNMKKKQGTNWSLMMPEKNFLNTRQLFIIARNSNEEFSSHLQDLSKSIYWNHAGFFIIIEMNFGDDCQNAFSTLWNVWTFDILYSIFICYSFKKNILLYTFNPYKNYAVDSWTETRQYEGIDGHPWTLFSKPYDPFSLDTLCGNLSFDKSKDIGGYPIKLSEMYHWAESIDAIIDNEDCDNKVADIDAFIKIQHESLNAKPISSMTRFMTMNDTQISLYLKNFDLFVNSTYNRVAEEASFLYPHSSGSTCIVTQKRTQQLPLLRVFELLTPQFIIYLLLMFLISTVLMKFIMVQHFLTAIMEVLRMILNSCTLAKKPRTPVRKMWFIIILFTSVLFNFYFNGRITSILTVPTPASDVNSMNDLEKSGYIVHAADYYTSLLSTFQFMKNRFQVGALVDCVKKAEHGEHVACVHDCQTARVCVGENNNVHFATAELEEGPIVFLIRPDWPLTDRSNYIMQALRESGIVKFKDELTFRPKRAFTSNPQFVAIKREQMEVYFCFLAIGLIVAAFVFLAEYKIGNLKYNRTRKFWNNESRSCFGLPKIVKKNIILNIKNRV